MTKSIQLAAALLFFLATQGLAVGLVQLAAAGGRILGLVDAMALGAGATRATLAKPYDLSAVAEHIRKMLSR